MNLEIFSRKQKVIPLTVEEMTAPIRIILSDESLFGNEAAEDEVEDIFSSYVLERNEIAKFIDPKRQIAVIRAYKGEGKSALLRLVKLTLGKQSEPPLLIHSTGSSLSPDLTSENSDLWVREWKKNLLSLAVREIGSTLSIAVGDDAISLVEEAEQNGFKSRSFVSAIVDRISSKVVPVDRQRTGVINPEQLLRRWAFNDGAVWFIVDDIDQNFENTALNRIKVSSFFIAVRQIANLIPQFRFRLAIRPNVWSIVKRQYEALTHVEQYIYDLSWSLSDFLDLLCRRIKGYLERTGQGILSLGNRRLSGDLSQRELMSLVFDEKMPWGFESYRTPEVILYTLSRQRPRWMIELCKVAAESAYMTGHTRIRFQDIEGQLHAFGKKRVDETISEFRSQCPQIQEILASFVGHNERFTTDQLLLSINNRVLQAVNPQIVGILGTPSTRELAHFLFQIGFLTARKEVGADYVHVSYVENPDLLGVRTNVDQGYSWEIHPVFRQALRLKNVVPSKKEK